MLRRRLLTNPNLLFILLFGRLRSIGPVGMDDSTQPDHRTGGQNAKRDAAGSAVQTFDDRARLFQAAHKCQLAAL